MKSITRLFLIFIVSSLFFTPCYSATNVEPINNLLNISGVTKQVKDIPSLFEEAITVGRKQGVQMSDEAFASILSAIYMSVNPDEIMEIIRTEIGNTLTEKEIQHLTKWYTSEKGKMITKKEKSASDPGIYQHIVENKDDLLIDTEKVKFAQTLDKLMGATDITMRIQEYSSLVTYSAFMSVMAPNVPVDIENYKSMVLPQLESLRPEMEKLIIAAMVYSYQDINMETLNQYKAFLSDSKTQTFNHKVIEGMAKGLERSIEKFAGTMAIIVSQNH